MLSKPTNPFTQFYNLRQWDPCKNSELRRAFDPEFVLLVAFEGSQHLPMIAYICPGTNHPNKIYNDACLLNSASISFFNKFLRVFVLAQRKTEPNTLRNLGEAYNFFAVVTPWHTAHGGPAPACYPGPRPGFTTNQSLFLTSSSLYFIRSFSVSLLALANSSFSSSTDEGVVVVDVDIHWNRCWDVSCG